VINDGIKLGPLAGDNTSALRLDLEAAGTGFGEMSLHDDRFPVVIWQISAIALIFDSNNNRSGTKTKVNKALDEEFSDLLFALLDEAFEALTPIGRRGFAAETEGYSCKNRTFAATVFTHNEIDQRTELNLEVIMAHEVIALNPFKNPVFGRHIGLITVKGVFLLYHLGRQ
jgi:hypothetical protein